MANSWTLMAFAALWLFPLGPLALAADGPLDGETGPGAVEGRPWAAAFLAPMGVAVAWYVDIDNVSGMEDGTSWARAFTTIQPAIDAASGSGGGEVWVAEGVYGEARSALVGYSSTDRGALFVRARTSLFGGFSGVENELDERDVSLHVTVIDGATSLNGEPALQVVYLQDSAVIDGFTVTGGVARGNLSRGGGISSTS